MRRLVSRTVLAPFRFIAYLLHATGLEKVYKPRFVRYAALLELDEAVLQRLPRYCHSMTGAEVDPINLIFVATDMELKQMFKDAKWNRAHPTSPLHLLYSLVMVFMKRAYPSAPFSPLYVSTALQDMSFQQATRANNIHRRHHIRIWRTRFKLSDGRSVWVAAASYDSKIKVMWRPPFMIHGQDPNFDKERDYVVRSLEAKGAVKLKLVPMTEPAPATAPRSNAFGAKYFTDGQAVVVQL